MAPLHCTALGKVLLAYTAGELPGTLEAFTPNTITDPVTLRQHLETVRQQGYALDHEEFEPGVRCIAVPVYDLQGRVIAAMGISGPATRITPQAFPALIDIVLEIGQELSGRAAFSLD
jgi:DNA-binding IclR family transcriptional regulator